VARKKNIQGIPMYRFQQRLKYIKAKLKKWNKETFGNIFKEKIELEAKMEQLQQHIIENGRTRMLGLRGNRASNSNRHKRQTEETL
jgi:hypothetical protein